MSEELTARLRQRGRASIDFFANIGHGMADVRSAVEKDIKSAVPDPSVLPDDLDQRDARMSQSLMGSRSYRVQQAVGEFHSSQHGVVARDAFRRSPRGN